MLILDVSVAGFGVQTDLSEVDHLSGSDDFQVWINGREHFVYESIKNGNHGTNNFNSIS